MTSVPTAPTPGVRAPLRERGFIASFGSGRQCAEPDCHTTLSRYNDSDRCYPHAELEARRHRAPAGRAR